MLKENYNFPRWSGPLVGMGVGVLVGLRAAPESEVPFVIILLGGALLGGFSGCLLMLLDPPAIQQGPASKLGRRVAVIAVLFSVVPVLGLLISSFAVWVNWRATDSPRLTSVIAFGVSSILTVPVLIGIVAAFVNGPFS